MKNIALLSVLCLTGCAGLDCGSDWYTVGRNDGRIGADSQLERYTAQCGAQVDRARYLEGLQAGFAMRPRVPSF